MLRVKTEGLEATISTIGSAGKLVPAEVRAAVGRITLKVQREVMQNKLTGQVLKVRTNRLRRSIKEGTYVSEGGPNVTTGVVGTNVEYARIHEFGGKTPAHEIRVRGSKALKFQLKSGVTAFRKSVVHPGSKMPERSFLRSALTSMHDEMVDEWQKAVDRAISKAK